MKRARILGNILKIDEIAIGPRLYEAVKKWRAEILGGAVYFGCLHALEGSFFL